MILAAEQLQFGQHQLNYHLRNISHLVSCFKGAHRSDVDNIADDRNRDLAKTGVWLVGLIENRCLSVSGTQPRGEMKDGSRTSAELILARYLSYKVELDKQQRLARDRMR